MAYVNESSMIAVDVLKLIQNEKREFIDKLQPEAFRGQANHAIYSNLILVTAILPGATNRPYCKLYIRHMPVIRCQCMKLFAKWDARSVYEA